MSRLHALLIAVDFYFPHELPGGIFYPSLGGCVRDISHVETYLTDRLKVQTGNILKLSATNVYGDHPAEPPQQWPTYKNMVAAFKELIDRVQPGDQVYIHYSGHGGRAQTTFPSLKTDQGVDETLVPTDIGQPNSQYLRDIELAYLLQQLVDKQVLLTVVFDSCHSGGATRGVEGKKAVMRGVTGIDKADRPQESLVASLEELAANWQRETAATRGNRTTSGWRLDPKGYTFLAACREAESAMEYPFNGHERNGALTYWMLDTLRQAGPGWSYKMLHDRILAKVHGQFANQTPQLQGEGDREIFGSNRIEPHYAVPILSVEPHRVRLNAGEAHGLQAGDKLAIYPVGSQDLKDPQKRSGVVTVTTVNGSSSWASIDEQGNTPIAAGDQAVLLTSLRLRRTVAFFDMDATQQLGVAEAIQEYGKGFVVLAGPEDQVDYQITVTPQGEYEINDSAGIPIANLRPALRVEDPNALRMLAERLVHVTKWRNVEALAAPDGTDRQKLKVDLVGDFDSKDETPVLPPGKRVTLRITNLQEPVQPDPHDPAKVLQPILNITILNLASDWSIEQIYPTGSTLSRAIDPGETLELAFDTVLADGQMESRDTLKVFAARDATNFRWLTLPALDKPLVRSGATRGAIPTDPLEQLLAAVTAETATRSGGLVFAGAEQQKSWTVAQKDLHIKRPETGPVG